MSLSRDQLYRKLRSTLLRRELIAVGVVMAVMIFAAIFSADRFSVTASRWLVYGSLALLVGLITLSWVVRWQKLQRRLADTESDLDQTRARMAAVLRLSHRFAQAQDEKSIIEQGIEFCLEVLPAVGASFVPLDVGSRPLPAVVRGSLPASMMADWGEYLAATSTRETCSSCRDHSAEGDQTCPLLAGPFESEAGIHCFPIRRGDAELGMLNLYLSPGDSLGTESLAFLLAVLDEMGMAIEAVRLREREVSPGPEIRLVGKEDLGAALPVLLEGLTEVTKAEWAFLFLYDHPGNLKSPAVVAGDPPPWDIELLQALLRSAHQHPDPVPISSIDLGGHPKGADGQAVAVNPLVLADGQVVGGVLLGGESNRLSPAAANTISRALSSQLAVAAHYAQQVKALEVQAVMAERVRLAREIHDGLAQTLGFLKLMTAQMQNFLVRGEDERLAGAMEMCRTALAEAYLDTRQAIDGLRLSPEKGLEGWLVQAADEFSVNHGLPVEILLNDTPARLPAEVQSQLVRIVQEALTNIRKHARASRVMIRCQAENGQLVLEIEDDGCGFEPLDLLGPARHGLRGMRERADLIHADLELISGAAQGTVVRLRCPLELVEARA